MDGAAVLLGLVLIVGLLTWEAWRERRCQRLAMLGAALAQVAATATRVSTSLLMLGAAMRSVRAAVAWQAVQERLNAMIEED